MNAQSLVKEICPTTAQSLIKNGARFVDIRESDDVALLAFVAPHIMNIPLSEFDRRYKEIPKDRDIIVVSSDPQKSLLAAGYLINHGFTNVVNMKYGLKQWVNKGYPTKGDSSMLNDNDTCCSPNSYH